MKWSLNDSYEKLPNIFFILNVKWTFTGMELTDVSSNRQWRHFITLCQQLVKLRVLSESKLESNVIIQKLCYWLRQMEQAMKNKQRALRTQQNYWYLFSGAHGLATLRMDDMNFVNSLYNNKNNYELTGFSQNICRVIFCLSNWLQFLLFKTDIPR